MKQFKKCSSCKGKGKRGFWSGYRGETCSWCDGKGVVETSEYREAARVKKIAEKYAKCINKYYKSHIIMEDGCFIDKYNKVFVLPDNNHFLDTYYERAKLLFDFGANGITKDGLVFYPSSADIKRIIVTEITGEEYNDATKK